MTTEGTFETTVEVGTEFLVRRERGRGERPDHQLGPGREGGETLAAQVAETALDTVPEDGAAHGATDHEADAGEAPRVLDHGVDDQEGGAAAAPGARDPTQVVTAGEAVLRGEHGRQGTRRATGWSSRGSDREALAALAATRGQDRPARAGAHAQPEPVRLVTAAVVRLVRTLAHDFSPIGQGRITPALRPDRPIGVGRS
jgi:hypothetical protein